MCLKRTNDGPIIPEDWNTHAGPWPFYPPTPPPLTRSPAEIPCDAAIRAVIVDIWLGLALGDYPRQPPAASRAVVGDRVPGATKHGRHQRDQADEEDRASVLPGSLAPEHGRHEGQDQDHRREIQGKRHEAQDRPAAVPSVGLPIDENLNIHHSGLTSVDKICNMSIIAPSNRGCKPS